MHPIVVIAGSAGGHKPLWLIISALPVPCSASIFVVTHIDRDASVLPSLLGRLGHPVSIARHGALIEAGRIYVAPPDYHMLLGPARIRLSRVPRIHGKRPAADPMFVSAALTFGPKVIGVVLSGAGRDAAAGLRAVHEHGGTAIVQDPDEAPEPGMPVAAITADHPASLTAHQIARRLTALVR